MATNLFFMGKGGVGKSTSAALTSIFMAERGHRVVLASLDPAHNQSDIFTRPLTDKPSEVSPRLLAMEIDQDRWMRAYLKDIQHQINETYAYLTAFNLEKYFSVIKHSPGLEEYALLMAFEKIRERYSHYDYLVFDMPPTALALKFFSLPSLSLVWIGHLLSLRREIIEKRELITRIKFFGKELERDKVLNKIDAERRHYQSLKDIFEDAGQTQLFLVLNPDILSHAESLRIFNALRDIKIPLFRLVYNKRSEESSCAAIDPVYKDIPMISLPWSETPLIGISNLLAFIARNGDVFENQISVC